MENTTFLFSSLLNGPESTLFMTAGVAGNRKLAAGLLLGYVLLGLASYIWAFWSQRRRLNVFKEAVIFTLSGQRHRLRGVQNIHNGVSAMLLIDVVNTITGILLATDFITYPSIHRLDYSAYYGFWLMFRYYGFVFHLLNALLSLIFLCHPQLRRATVLCVYGPVFLLVSVFLPIYSFAEHVSIIGMGAIIIVLAVVIIAKFIVSIRSPSAATRKKLIVLVVAMFTFLIVFAPTFILQCLMISAPKHGEPTAKYRGIFENVLFCTNFQILTNGLLCYFILKLPSEEEQQQQQQQQEQQEHPSFENSNYDSSANVIT